MLKCSLMGDVHWPFQGKLFYIEIERKKLNQEVYKNILLGLKISPLMAWSI